MNDERLAELKEKYKDRNLLEELAWGIYWNHSGYTSKQNGEFLNWLCLMAYKALKEKERPQGEWISREDMDYLDKNKVVHNHFQCNKCGLIHDFIDGHTSQYNFCPNCGAEMRGNQNGK